MKRTLFSLFSKTNGSLGKQGEQIAREYLERNGFSILATSYRNPEGRQLGEIDIIAKRDGAIVFVEVKTRTGKQEDTFPEDNLTPSKLRKLEKIATHYLQAHQQTKNPYHFDAIAITLNGTTPSIRHFEHIFF